MATVDGGRPHVYDDDPWFGGAGSDPEVAATNSPAPGEPLTVGNDDESYLGLSVSGLREALNEFYEE